MSELFILEEKQVSPQQQWIADNSIQTHYFKEFKGSVFPTWNAWIGEPRLLTSRKGNLAEGHTKQQALDNLVKLNPTRIKPFLPSLV